MQGTSTTPTIDLDTYRREDITIRKARRALTWARHNDTPYIKAEAVDAAVHILATATTPTPARATTATECTACGDDRCACWGWTA